MVFPRNFVFLVFIGCVSFLKYSISQKPEDCVKGIEYWSTSSVITSNGACVKCPSNWRTCYEQPVADEVSCVNSCRVKPTLKPKSKATPTTIIPLQPAPSTPPKATNNSNVSLAVVNQSEKHPPEINEIEGQKSDVAEDNRGKMVLIFFGCISGFLVLIIVALLVYLKTRENPAGHRDELSTEEQEPLESPLQNVRNDHELQDEHEPPLERQPDNVAGRIDEEQLGMAIQDGTIQSSMKQLPIVQASSSTNVHQPKDTEELSFSSKLNLDEEES